MLVQIKIGIPIKNLEKYNKVEQNRPRVWLEIDIITLNLRPDSQYIIEKIFSQIILNNSFPFYNLLSFLIISTIESNNITYRGIYN